MTTDHSKKMPFVFDDGGRQSAGFKGSAGDCVARAIAIAAQLPYRDVYDQLAQGNANQRRGKRPSAGHGKRTARDGINTRRKWFRDYMASLGWQWVPTMHIGSGCKVHLVPGELPSGRLIVAVSKHYTAVIDGVIRDIANPQRATQAISDGHVSIQHRCVYGYWRQA